MAQQVQTLSTSASSNNLDYLDHPSETHGFLVSVIVGVLATWGFAFYLVFTFHN